MPGFAQLLIQQKVPGKTGQRIPIDTVLNYTTSSTPMGWADLPNFLTAWRATNEAAMLACRDFSWAVEAYFVKELSNPGLAQYENNLGGTPLTGTYNSTPGAPGPSINAAFYFFKSLNSGRSSKGGMHGGGIPLAGIAGNEFTSAYLILLNAFLASLLTTFTDSGGKVWNLSILSRKNSNLGMPPPPVNVQTLLAFASRCFVDKDVGTMRRRKEATVR